MTLSTKGLDWLAANAGSGNCFATGGIVYKDGGGTNHTGSTGDVVNALYTASQTRHESSVIIANTSYNQFISASINGHALTMGDIDEAWDREESGESAGNDNYPQYCASGGTPGPSPSPPAGDKPVTGPLEVYVGGGESCDPGTPSVTIDTSEAYAFFKATPHEYIGVGGIMVHNQSNTCRAYFAWEARIWDGYGYTTCPETSPIHQEINRFLANAGERPLSLKRLDASETAEIWGSFETLPSMEGEYTLCLSLWGNNDYEALIAELNNAGYYDKS